MDIHAVRLLLKTKSIYDLSLRVTYYARVSSESDEQLNSLGGIGLLFPAILTKVYPVSPQKSVRISTG